MIIPNFPALSCFRGLLAALACLTASVRAGTWSFTEWTGDSTTHIAAGQTVWAYHFDSTTTATVNGVAVPGIAGGNPAVAGQFTVGNTPNTIGGDHSNELTRAGLGGSAEMAKRFIYNGSPTQVNIEGLTTGQTYTVSFFGVDWANQTRIVTFESLPDSLVVNENHFGADRGIRVDYTFLATASTRFFTITPQAFNTTWHFYGLALRQEAAATVVTNANDAGTGSLRWALANAAAIPGANTITFDAALSGQTITTLSELAIGDSSVTIDASALTAPVTIFAGGTAHRLITHLAGSLTLRRLRLENGNAGADLGGAVRSSGSAFAAFDCAFIGNTAGLTGSALNLATSGTIEGCTFSGNTTTASGSGGAIAHLFALTVRKSTLVSNSTFPGASAANAGAILSAGPLTLEHCTVTGNQCGSGGGGALLVASGGSATITNSILADNATNADVNNATGSAANLTYTGANIVRVAANALFTGPAPLTADPLLGTFGANGGPTDTRAPLFGSPAIDVASTIAGHSTDQRGFSRPFDGDGNGTATPDLGAVESYFLIVSNGNDSGPGSLRQAVADAATATFAGPSTIVFRPASFPTGGVVNLTADLAIPAAGDTAGLTLATAVAGGNVDVAVNAGTLSWGEEITVWTGGGRILLGATSGSAAATVEITDPDGLSGLAAPIVVRAGSSGVKTLRDANTNGVLPNTFAGDVTLFAPATVEATASGRLNFTGQLDLGPHVLTVGGSGSAPITMSGRVFRSDGIGKAQIAKTGSASLTLAGSGDNSRLAVTVDTTGLLLGKTASATVHALGGDLTAADGAALTIAAGASVVANAGDQIADTATVTVDGTLALLGGEILDALNGNGLVQSSLGAATLTVGAAGGTGDFGGQLQFNLSLIKTGAGVQTLSGASSATGAVTVNGGTLNVTGSLANVSGAAVETGATLAGTGSIGSTIVFQSGAFLAPGDATVAASRGTLSATGSATWNGGATARFHLSATDDSADTLAVTGALTKGTTGAFLFDFLGTGVAGQTYTLATFASSNFAVTDFSYSGLAPGLVGYFTKTATTLTFTTATFSPVVTSTADSGPGSLRQVLLDAAQIPGANVITFPPELSGATITLGSEIGINDATGGVTLDATNLPDGLTLDGGPGANRIFNVNASNSLTLRGVTLTGGNGGGANGGALSNAGTLTLERCTLVGNSATSGGALLNGGTAAATLCTFTENTVSGPGGAIANQAGATLSLIHCTLARNTAAGAGAIANSGTLTLNSTLAAANSPDNVTGAFTGANNLTSGDPRLARLARNGGPTATMALLPFSPALDAAAVIGGITTDQRGFTRGRGVAPDIGAYEAQVAPVSSAGFNFVGGGVGGPGGTLAAADVAGVPEWAQVNWNNFTGTIDGVPHDGTYGGNGPVPLVNASGIAFSPNLRIWWAADHLWNISAAVQSSPDRRLMNGYLDSNFSGTGYNATNLYASTASQPFFAVAGLPVAPGGYKVIVYTDGDATDRVGEYWLTTNRAANPGSVASEVDLTPHLFVRDAANFFDTFTRVPSTSTTNLGLSTPAGNYAVFEGLTEPGFIVRAEEAVVSAPLNAVQVVRNEIVVVTTAIDELDPNGTLGAGLSLREALRDASEGAGILFDSSLSGATVTLDAAKGEIVLAKDVTIDAGTLAAGITVDGGAGVNRVFTVSSGKAVTLVALTLSGGAPGGNGGAVLNLGALTLNRCTVTGNAAAEGGGIHSDGLAARLHATACTFSGNTASGAGGGAVSNGTDAATQLTHCTISSNQAPGGAGGGIRRASGTVTITHSIVAGNTANADANVSGTIVQTGANLTAGNPLLAPLASNGGPTQTMALLAGSPARNAAIGSTATSDQRGSPIVGVPDLGAYEANDTPTTNYSAWSLAVAGSVLPSGDDTEKDGAINALEYALRRNPNVSDASLNPTLTGPIGGRSFAFRYQPTANDLRYIVQRNTDLNNAAGWTEIYRFDLSTGVATEHPSITADENATTQVITLLDPAPGARLFWRLRIELLP
jgi:autotransporter-associated beta strand protein